MEEEKMGLAVPLLQRLAVAAERFLFQGRSRRVPTGTRKQSEGSNRDQEAARGTRTTSQQLVRAPRPARRQEA